MRLLHNSKGQNVGNLYNSNLLKFILSIVFIAVFSLGYAQTSFRSTGLSLNWTDPGAWVDDCGGCRNYPGEGGVIDDVVEINHPVVFNSASATGLITVGALTIANTGTDEASLSVYGDGTGGSGAVLTVTGSVFVTGSGSNNAILMVDDNASINVTGDLNITRYAGQAAGYSVQLQMYSSSSMVIGGSLNYAYNNTAGAEATDEMDLGRVSDLSFPTLNIYGDLNIDLNSDQSSSMNISLKGTTQFTVGADGAGNATIGVVNGGSGQTINLFLSDVVAAAPTSDTKNSNLTDGSDVSFSVNGDFTFNLPDDADGPAVNTYIRGHSDMLVAGNLICNHSNATTAGDIFFKLADFGTLTCQNFNFTSTKATADNNIYVNAFENAYLTVNGDINMAAAMGSPTANYIGMYDDSTLDLKGNVNRGTATGADSDGSIEFLDGSNSLARFSGSGSQSIYVTYSGTSAWQQNIGSSNPITAYVYRNLEVANTSGIPLSLDDHVVIRSSLTLTQGIINTTASGYIVFPYVNTMWLPPITATAGNSLSYIDGPVRKLGPNDFVIPIGDGSNWAPVSISNMLVSGSVDSNLFPDLFIEYHAQGAAPLGTDGTLTPHANEYWSISSDPVFPNQNVTADIIFNWKDACFSGITDATDAQLFMAATSGGNWTSLPSAINSPSAACDAVTPAAETGSITSAVSLDAISNFSTTYWFDFASPTTLPVELIDFKAVATKGSVLLKWSTAMEHLADRFEIERSYDGRKFIKVAEIRAAGESVNTLHYSVEDENVQNRAFYRLKMIDLDGKYEYSHVISADIPWHSSDRLLYCYGQPPRIRVLSSEGPTVIFIHGSDGRFIAHLQLHQGDEYALSQLNLPAGVYLITARSSGYRQTERIFIY